MALYPGQTRPRSRTRIQAHVGRLGTPPHSARLFTDIEGHQGFDKTQHRFGAHVEAGLQLFLSEHLSLDSTYRHIWLEKIDSKDASLQDKQFRDNGHMVTFGLNLHF